MTDEWQPILEERIWDEINDAWMKMNFEQRRVWEIVRIIPEKWKNERKYYGHGSWVVAIIGRMLIWYDDLEEGFRRSLWTRYLTIDDDCCTGDCSLQEQLNMIPGYFNTNLSGPPAEYFP